MRAIIGVSATIGVSPRHRLPGCRVCQLYECCVARLPLSSSLVTAARQEPKAESFASASIHTPHHLSTYRTHTFICYRQRHHSFGKAAVTERFARIRLTMFKRSFTSKEKDRAGKARKISKRSFRDDAKQRMREALNNQTTPDTSPSIGGASPKLNSSIVTVVVGKDQRLFAAHEDVLCRSPWFAEACRQQFFSSPGQRRITLPDEEPEIFSAVLEYLYKGDYYPRLLHDRKRNTWSLEDASVAAGLQTMSPRSDTTTATQKKFVGFNESATIYHHGVGDYILRDTAVYCAALRFSLPEMQRLALRKQGLQSGIDVATILRSARFAYANTPASDSRLRAHYLALIIRSRKTFKRSGTMQMEMEKGSTQMFFDLFVAM